MNSQNNTSNIAKRLAITKKLQNVTNKIHATSNIDEILIEVSDDIRGLFEVDRLTIYIINDDKNAIISKVKTGLNSIKEIKLPLNHNSIAGWVASNKTLVNIKNVYDKQELNAIDKNLTFLTDVDLKTGFKTKQMLAFPIIDELNSLIGVVQAINTLNDEPFDDLSMECAYEIAKTLKIAYKQKKSAFTPMMSTKYDYLVDKGIVSRSELEAHKSEARKINKDIEDYLIDIVKIPSVNVLSAISYFFDTPSVSYDNNIIKPVNLLKNLKYEFLLENQWVPVDETKDGIIVATPEPAMLKSSRIVNGIFSKTTKILYKVCLKRDFVGFLDHFYKKSGLYNTADLEDIINLDDSEDQPISSANEDQTAAQDNELVLLVNKIIIDAYNMGASDIHIEPYPDKKKTQIRIRKDGSLIHYIETPDSYRNAMVARLKIMCDLDISEKRKPQDGKIKFKKFAPLDIELRVATIPTAGGLEDVVMRILAAGEPIPLDKLGLSNRNNAKLKELVSKPYGLFFVCGPTGSGKTTTLHSALGFINTPETKIWTAEDPVEITQKGLRQVQVNKKAGLDFATVMKAFLRADPDVIMVGEMRDKETVSTGIEASLTGHLVFATLHTNSAPESITRLLDMGMDPFNFSDALLGILAQRLAKRLCGCKEEYAPTKEELKEMLNEYCQELKNTAFWKKDPEGSYKKIWQEWVTTFSEKGAFKLYRAKGCDKCNNTGYKGRVGLHELLEGTDAIKKNIQEHARVAEMFATAMDDGMRTLKQDGIEKVLQGVTDMKQVRLVCIK